MHGSVRFDLLEACDSINFVNMKNFGQRRVLKQELCLWRTWETGIIMNEINCIKRDQPLIHATKNFA